MKKYVTFSYDDGVESDIRLVETLDRYGAKCTFNLNSGLMEDASHSWDCNGFVVRRLPKSAVRNLYKGHEIAVHTLTHPHLETLDDKTILQETKGDKDALEDLFGREVVGMAYPYGTYSHRVLETIADCGIRYSRTVEATHGFSSPENPLLWGTTCHHRDPELLHLVDSFLETECERPMVISIWGHSYEYDGYGEWGLLETVLRKLSSERDVVFCTNREALEKQGVRF